MPVDYYLSRLPVLLGSNFELAFREYKHLRLVHILLNTLASPAIVLMYISRLCLIDVLKDDIPSLSLTQHSMSHPNIREYTSMPYKIFIPIGGRVAAKRRTETTYFEF